MTTPEPMKLHNHSNIELPDGFQLYEVYNAGTPDIKNLVKHRVTTWSTSCWYGFVRVWRITEDCKLLLVGANTFGANEFVPVGPFEANTNSCLELKSLGTWDSAKVMINMQAFADPSQWLVENELTLEELKQVASTPIKQAVWSGFYPYYTVGGKAISYRSRNILTGN